jgi:hypothetical protein
MIRQGAQERARCRAFCRNNDYFAYEFSSFRPGKVWPVAAIAAR